MTRWVCGALLAGIAFVLSCGSTSASYVTRGAIAARNAPTIVLVESVSKSIDLDDRSQFRTTYKFRTLRVIKGDVDVGEEIVIRFLGIRQDDVASVTMPEDLRYFSLDDNVPDGPPGSRFILFLGSNVVDGRFGYSKHYEVQDETDGADAWVSTSPIFYRDIPLFHAEDGSPYDPSVCCVPLEDFIYSLVVANREIPLADPPPPPLFQSIVISDSASWLAAEPGGCLVFTHRLAAGSDLRWTGQCVDSRIEGRGTLEWVLDGEVVHEIMAKFENGRSISGTYRFPNGDTYTGWLSEGVVFHRSGGYEFVDGTSYSGKFEQGIPDGRGTFLDPEGVSYRGEFVGGLRHGIGVCLDRTEADPWPDLCEYRNDRFYKWL